MFIIHVETWNLLNVEKYKSNEIEICCLFIPIISFVFFLASTVVISRTHCGASSSKMVNSFLH